MRTFLINLDRDAERLKVVKKRLDDAGISFERISAVYGKELSLEEKKKAVNRWRFRMAMGRDVFDGEIGCALSHAKIYKKMLAENIPVACVFEDDVVVKAGFQKALADVEHFADSSKSQVILLSDHVNAAKGKHGIVKIDNGFATEAYVITLPAAHSLLQVMFPMRCACDHWKRWAKIGAIDLYGLFPAVATQAWEVFESHIKPKTHISHGVFFRGWSWVMKCLDQLIIFYEHYSQVVYDYRYDSSQKYSINSNASQKIKLVNDFLNQGIAFNIKQRIFYCIAASIETDFIRMILRHCFLRQHFVLFCWDPPGIYWRDRKDWLGRLRIWGLSQLQSIAIACSERTIFNLHRGFAERFLWKNILKKCAFFPNGTCVDENQKAANGVEHIPHRIAISNAFMVGKGSQWIAERLVEVKGQIPDLSVVWVGADHGDLVSVREKLLTNGFTSSDLVHLGPAKHAEALRLWASAEIGLNAYPDLPSVKWNYVLKIPEFMSLGLPIVSVDLPGVHEYINQKTGILFSPNDAAGAVNALEEFLLSPSKIAVFRQSVLENVKNYDWCVINQKIAEELP